MISIMHWISADSWRRFAIALLTAVITFFVLCRGLSLPTRAVMAWDSFAIMILALAWLTLAITTQKELRAHARVQDLSRIVLFVFVVSAACIALFAVGYLLRARVPELHTAAKSTVLLALSTVALSWGLLHTLYSLHYAHIFYGDSDDPNDDNGLEEGLDFPSERMPDYFDFAYFSFVIGMTCQVSDVQVRSGRMRRVVLVHGILAFGFNTFILALLINIVSGLI
jgi:uncharacterized membrane protein